MIFKNIVGFEWDAGNWPKCGKHGLSRDEIESVFFNNPAVHSHPSHSATEERFKAIGRNDAGRMIYLSFTIRQGEGGNYIRPVSARYMHAKEVKRYDDR